jgi:hypothetical protein
MHDVEPIGGLCLFVRVLVVAQSGVFVFLVFV